MTAKTSAQLTSIDESDTRLHHRNWMYERIGWSFMGVALFAAAIGLLGPGPLSATTNRTPDRSITVSYNRFEHQFAPTLLDATIAPDAVHGDLRLQLNRDFLSRVDILRMIPEPESSELSDRNITYVFPLKSNHGPIHVGIRYEPLTRGWLPIIVGAESGMKLQIKQFVFP